MTTRLTHRRVAAGLAVVLSTGVLALASHALADGGNTTTVSIGFGPETWYQPQPTCSLPTGCVSAPVTPPAVNPYGTGSLHVAVSAGQETARSYLNLLAVTAPTGATLSKAEVTIPLDTTTTTDGSSMVDTSTPQICASTATITANEGEFDDPPALDCMNSVALTYSATPAPELTADLAPLITPHLADLAAGKLDLAVLPLLNGTSTATWHDVFAAHGTTSLATKPTSLSLTFTSAGDAAPVVVADSPTPTPSATDTSSSAPSTAATLAPVARVSSVTPVSSPVAVAAPAAAVPVGPVNGAIPGPAAPVASAAPSPQVASSDQAVASQAPVGDDAAPAAAASVTTTVGFAYPAVLLLPIVLLAGGAGLARVMTRDVTPKRKTDPA